jgi:intracellular sulfur oxidation DsrE/DsrF family protein
MLHELFLLTRATILLTPCDLLVVVLARFLIHPHLILMLMKLFNPNQTTHRRGFLGLLTSGAAAFGATTLLNPLQAMAKTPAPLKGELTEADAWFEKIKGKHRVVFDATRPHDLFPFAWPRVFLLTNASTGTPEKENSVVVVLRHDAIPYAFEDRLWKKYKFGELFKADDPATKARAVRNPFAKPKPGEYAVPGVGEIAIGINELQASGVMFCVCDAAITVYSTAVAESMKLQPAEVKKDWLAGLLPGIQPVPSGVWALGRAQEKNCAYIFAG